MNFIIRRSRNGYEVALIERTGKRQVYRADFRASHGSLTPSDALELCRVYGRGLVDNGHNVVDAVRD